MPYLSCFLFNLPRSLLARPALLQSRCVLRTDCEGREAPLAAVAPCVPKLNQFAE